LGNVNKKYEIIKPMINEYLMNEVIFYKRCAAFHSIVLTLNIELFVWGIIILDK
jgi:hypothetical protein